MNKEEFLKFTPEEQKELDEAIKTGKRLHKFDDRQIRLMNHEGVFYVKKERVS